MIDMSTELMNRLQDVFGEVDDKTSMAYMSLALMGASVAVDYAEEKSVEELASSTEQAMKEFNDIARVKDK